MFKVNARWILIIFVCFAASFRIVGPLRLLELCVIIFVALSFLIFLYQRKISKFTLILCLAFSLMILRLLLYPDIEDLQFTIRQMLAFITFQYCVTYFEIEKCQYKFYKLTVVLLLCIGLGLYSYVWESSVPIGMLLVNYLVHFNILMMLSLSVILVFIGQKTGVLAVAITSLIFWSREVRLQRLTLQIIAMFICAYGVYNLTNIQNMRAIKALTQIDLSDLYMAARIAIEVADNYTYEQFVYEQRSTLTESGDLSSHLRIRKWAIAAVNYDLKGLLLGLGGGFFGKGADSGWIRVFVEQGAIVGTIFVYYFYKVMKGLSTVGVYSLLVLLIGNLFLDLTQSVYTMAVAGIILGQAKKYAQV